MSSCGCAVYLDMKRPDHECRNYPLAPEDLECCECDDIIIADEKYENLKVWHDNTTSTFKTCMSCVGARSLLCSYYYTMVWDLIRECMNDDDNIPWSKIGKLDVKARARICDYIESRWQEYEYLKGGPYHE